jgi:hypothetical protein
MKYLRKVARVYGEQGLTGLSTAVRRKLANTPTIPVIEWSEYLNWLSFAVPGMLRRGNVDCFDYALRHLPSKGAIVEIGSFCGLSTNVIGYLKRRHGVPNPFVTCDRWIFEGADQSGLLEDSGVSFADYSDFVKQNYRRNIQLFNPTDTPFTIELFSDEFFAAWSERETRDDVLGRPITLGGPIAFCYIDGNHTYEFARRDFENTDRFLQPGGFILFDDSGDGSGWEVCRLMPEVLSTGRYRLVSKAPNYLFQKKQ